MASSLTGRTPKYLAAVKGREPLLAELRRRGARGGVIGQHRSMTSGRLSPSIAVSTLVFPLLMSALVALALRPIGVAWTIVLDLLRQWTALPGEVVTQSISLGTLFSFTVPYLTTPAAVPAAREMAIVGSACAVATIASFALPARWLPLCYYLRFATLVQLTAFLNFAIRPATFPYALPQYLLSLLEIGCAVLVLVPIVYGLTLFPFDIALWRKIALTAATVVHLAVLLPLQLFVHAYLIHHLSLLVMPSLFLLWGLLLHIFVIVTFYGIGMSWPEVIAPRPRRRAA